MNSSVALETKQRRSMSLTTSRGFTNGLSNDVGWKSANAHRKRMKMIKLALSVGVSFAAFVIVVAFFM